LVVYLQCYPSVMTSTTTKSAKRATQIYFLLCGLAISAWAPMVPFVKDMLRLDDSNLGLLLLFLGIGAFCAMPFAGWLMKRFGSRLVMIVSAVILSAGLPVLTLLDTFVQMAAMLFVFGASLGALDVSMNTHGSMVQNVAGKPIMSSLHGLFSTGGLFGPLLIGALLKLGLSPLLGATALSVVLLILAVSQQSSLFTADEEDRFGNNEQNDTKTSIGQKNAWVHGTVLFLGMMCFIAFLSEGAMLDWSALLLHDSKGVDKALSGLGYAFFSVAMAAMRLAGDRIVSKFSSRYVVLFGSMIAFVGYTCILLAGWLPVTLLGFILIGIGAANIVPVFFSAAGSMKDVASASAVSTMGTIGYTGQLAGPAILGVLAQHFSLPVALFITGVLMLVAGVVYWVSQRGKVE
jgi:fucose permease